MLAKGKQRQFAIKGGCQGPSKGPRWPLPKIFLEQANNRQLSDHSASCQDFWPQQLLGSVYGESMPVRMEWGPAAEWKVDRKGSFTLTLFQGTCCCCCDVAQSCPTPSDPMDCSPPGSSVHGIFQATVLEWGAIAFSSKVLSFCLIPCSPFITEASSIQTCKVASVVSDSLQHYRL